MALMHPAQNSRRAVLLLAHGTPENLDQIPAYLSNVVGGRPVPEALVHEIRHRYSLIGQSPLTVISQRQASLLEAELARIGSPAPVYLGMRNWRPYIADVLRQMRADGIEEAVAICLAPQNSRTSVGLYRRAVEAAAEGIRIVFVDSWATHPKLIAAFAERLCDAYTALNTPPGEPATVLFTAHSVPVRTVQPEPGVAPDPYAEDARRTAALVAAQLPQIVAWDFAFQSQGAGGGPWMGPTVEEKLDALAAAGVKTVLLQPIGFLCDHVEILYDIDMDFRNKAAAHGLRLERAGSLNDSGLLIQALAELASQECNPLPEGI